MELFEKDIFEGKLSKYETNHFHMVIDGNFELPIDSMKNDDYGTFIHEYIHYLQHITTLFGVKICAMYNKMFVLYMNYFKKNQTIYLPLKLWEKDEGLANFIQYFKDVRGDKNCDLNINEVEVDIREIKKAKDTRTAVNIGVYDFENDKVEECGFKFGYSCIVESMAHLVQSFINDDTNHANIPYRSVELICENQYKEISKDKKKMISICLCSLMFNNPGASFFEVIEVSKKHRDLNGFELFKKIMRDCSVKYKEKEMPMYRALHNFLDDLKVSTEAAIGTKLDYYAEVIDHCKKEASSGECVLLDILYNGDITDKKYFSEVLSKVYGYPFIEANNTSIMPQKIDHEANTTYVETAALLGLEMIIKRIKSEESTLCSWFKICKIGMYDPSIDCVVSPECENNQWDKKEQCLMTESMDFFKIRQKTFIQK